MSRWFCTASVAAVVAATLIGCQDGPPTGLEDSGAQSAAAPAYSTTSSTEGLESGAGLIHACYIPGSGMVYRISADGVEGLKEDCRAKQHIEFSWSPGLALAGQMCPAGEFVVGFDASGNIVCAVPGGDPPPPPPPPPPSPPPPPVIDQILVTPDPAFDNDDLVCTVIPADIDPHDYTFSWYEDVFAASPIQTWTTTDTENVLPASSTNVGSTYWCGVTPDADVEVFGPEVIVYDEACRADPSLCGL